MGCEPLVVQRAADAGCGDGIATGAEVCDGADVRGATCGQLASGVVRCAATCDGFDLSACVRLVQDAGTLLDAGMNDDAGPDAGLEVVDAGAPSSSMALEVRGGAFALADGGLVDVRGAVSCCGGGYGWPLVDEAWLDLTAANGITFLHLRLGPFLTTSTNGETDLAAFGGGYLEAGGKADLRQFNPRFWTRLRALLRLARARGQWVEVDVIDAWAIKHCRWGDLPGYSAWERASNVQNDDLCATAGSGPIAPGSVAEAWVRKVVQETGDFDNVLYQDGNELDLVQGYSPAWTTTMRDLIRAEEHRLGFGRHLIGTNSNHATSMRAVDYVERHQSQPASPADCLGKPCLVNEYNPNPPLTAAQLHERFCQARSNGTTFWYWRHGQRDAELSQSLALVRQGCP